MKILIAEDDIISRTIFQRAVENLGHEYLVAEDGDEAWKLYQENPSIEVVISDWMMPGTDGLELCRRIRENELDTYAYFLFLTALEDKEHLVTGLQSGADDYLTKPLDQAELQARLTTAYRFTSLHQRLAGQNAELKKLNHLLFEQSREDPLTSLGNRLKMNEDLEKLHGQVQRYGQSYAAVLCDVDRFKDYNDRYGHQAGDELLKEVARTITYQCREGDTAYRYGGEEFLVILPEQSLEKAASAAERLRQAVEELDVEHKDGVAGVVTISAGVAMPPNKAKQTPHGLLAEADKTLYRAKMAGRNRVALNMGARDPRYSC